MMLLLLMMMMMLTMMKIRIKRNVVNLTDKSECLASRVDDDDIGGNETIDVDIDMSTEGKRRSWEVDVWEELHVVVVRPQRRW